MGDVLNRGTRDRPLWYCRFIDVDGRRKQRPTRQPTKELAKRYLTEIEARIARGVVGVPEIDPSMQVRRRTTVRELCERFIAEYGSPRIKDLRSYRIQARTFLVRH